MSLHALATAIVARQQEMPSNMTEKPTGLQESPYGYTPALANCVAFLVVFSLLTVVHLGLAIKFKYWSAIATVVAGGFLEILGWAGRLWSSNTPLSFDGFIMQICCLIIGPVFFSAWDYVLLGQCIKHLGDQYSLLGANWYIIVFLIFDIISLVLQAIGGGQASVQAQNYEDTTAATHIMLGGIIFQLVISGIFATLAIDFIIRVTWNKPYSERYLAKRDARKNRRIARKAQAALEAGTSGTPSNASVQDEKDVVDDVTRQKKVRGSQILLIGVGLATIMIVMRGIYRSIELAEGWTGYVITTERFFIWLDGFPMVLCMASLAVFHPGFFLPRVAGWK